MTKKYAKKYQEEGSKLAAVATEFQRLEKAFRAYEKAMQDRMTSATFNGDLVNRHSVDIDDSELPQVYALRGAASDFCTKIGGGISGDRLFREISELFHRLSREIEKDAILK